MNKRIIITLLILTLCFSAFSNNGVQPLFDRNTGTISNSLFKDARLEIIPTFLKLQEVIIYSQYIISHSNFSQKEIDKVSIQTEKIEKYKDFLLNKIVFSKNNISKSLKIINTEFSNGFSNASKLNAFFIKPLISSIIEKYRASELIIGFNVLRNYLDFINDVNQKELSNFYSPLMESYFNGSNPPIMIVSATNEQVSLLYFDKESRTFQRRTLRAGDSFLFFTIQEILSDRLLLTDNRDGSTAVLGFDGVFSANTSRSLTTSTIQIVPFFENKHDFTVQKGSKFNLYLKVLENGRRVYNKSVYLDNYKFSPNSHGMITIPFDTKKISSSRSFTVTCESASADFSLKIKNRKAFFNYSASLGLNAGFGLDVIAADVTLAVNPSYGIGMTLLAENINSKNSDKLIVSVSPEFTTSLSASLGPKLKPLSIKAFDYNLGASASATVGANAGLTFGLNNVYIFKNPYTSDRKAEMVLFTDKLLDFSPATKPITSSLLAKLSHVNTSDYMSSANIGMTGKMGVSGNIGANLGLVEGSGNEQSVNSGVSVGIVSGSASLSSGIKGGIINGFTMYGPTDDKYSVTLTSSLSGSFSAGKLSAKIFNTKLVPDYFLDDRSGHMNMSFIFRFDENKRFTKSIIILSAGYEIRNNVYNKFIKHLMKELKDSGASSNDYAELFDVHGVEKQYIFIVDRQKTQKYFSEWLSFSKVLLNENAAQNSNKVSAKVKGMFGAVSKSLRRMAEFPIFYIERTNLALGSYSPGIEIALDLGVKVNLGIATSFSKSKKIDSSNGFLSSFKLYKVEECPYNKEIAKSHREITYLLNQLKVYAGNELKDTASYVYQKAKDGTVYIVKKAKDGAVYVIKIAANGVTTMAKKTGEAAKHIWNTVIDSVGTAAEYYYDASTEVVNSIGNGLQSIWDYIWN